MPVQIPQVNQERVVLAWLERKYIRRPKYAVVYFFYRQDNTGIMRPFRYIKTFGALLEARAKFANVKRRYPYAALLYKEKIEEECGSSNIIDDWLQSQKDVNRGVDPLIGSSYGQRAVFRKKAKKRYFE